MRFLLTVLICIQMSYCADILMVTMGGTKSHKIPFWELAKGLVPRGHNITFLNGFPADFSLFGLQEITPAGLVEYIQNYTNWDLVGARMKGVLPVSLWDTMRYPYESCDAMLEDAETKDLLNRNFDLLILDGAFPECLLGYAYKLRKPFMYINTVGFYTGSLSVAGNPSPYSFTPVFYAGFTDDMNLFQRISNLFHYIAINIAHPIVIESYLQPVLHKHFGQLPNIYDMSKNVSFILQNGHHSVTYPRPFLPNVAEIACIHCKPATALPKDLEDFVSGSGGESGFIYVSMGSSVKAANMPEHLRRLLVQTFKQLPYRVLWKWEGGNAVMKDLPPNVKLGRWLPQQDILGHRKLRAFVTHGGLLSMFETVYHGVPVVTMPVFCDHDANAAKAELDGYAYKLDLETITTEKLLKAILKVIHDPKYRQAVKKRQKLLMDQKSTPLDTAVYWTEYVIRHNGAYHLQSPSRNLSVIQYYLIDVIGILTLIVSLIGYIIKRVLRQELIHSTSRTKQKIN